MVKIAEYGELDDGTWELQNCQILGRLPGYEHWFQFGACETFRLEVATSKIEYKGRHQRVRFTSKSVVTDTSATASMRAMQFSDELRQIQMMSKEKGIYTQDAGDLVLDIQSVKLGGIYYMPGLNITLPTIKVSVYDAGDGTYTPGAAIAGAVIKIVDEAAGAIQVISGPAEGDCVQLGATGAAITEAAGLINFDFATETQLEIELKVRGLSAVGTPFIYDVYRWQTSPSGIDFIGGDDLMGQDLAGAALRTNAGIGKWQKLAA